MEGKELKKHTHKLRITEKVDGIQYLDKHNEVLYTLPLPAGMDGDMDRVYHFMQQVGAMLDEAD